MFKMAIYANPYVLSTVYPKLTSSQKSYTIHELFVRLKYLKVLTK